MNRRSLVILTVVIALVAVVAAVGFQSRVSPVATAMPTAAPLKVGDAAPPFQVASTAGPLDSTTVGKPIFLELFATWCPHCQREVPTLNKIFREYGSRLAMVAVCASATGSDEQSPETQADVVGFAEHFGAIYPIAYDPDLSVAHKYMQSGYPTIVTITKDGKIASLSDGEVSEADLRKRVLAVLK